jgi:mannose-6-phosphate isomerase-like protein (cupin superfamily)|tara:strand:+ start:453 stop:788 length:336 start_codon:yes stop_codon:yes gene_type:complete
MNIPVSSANIDKLVAELTEPWDPIEVVRFGEHVVRLAKFEGEYHWHTHEHEDELFYVYKGEITIQLRDQKDLVIGAGEFGVIPQGTEHCPRSTETSYVLIFEPIALDIRGD